VLTLLSVLCNSLFQVEALDLFEEIAGAERSELATDATEDLL
jgi:hypothetical protein